MKNRGITLIALIVTIIVLLILVGISIATLTGENGIITQAGVAKEETEISNEKEVLEKAIVESIGKSRDGSIEESNLKTEIDKQTGEGRTQVTTMGQDFKVIFLESKRKYSIDSDGNIKQILPLNPGEIATVTDTDNYSDGTKTATIPEGFKVSEKEGEQTIDTGLVVIGPDGSEFVWIPVEIAVTDSETSGNTNKAMAINLGTESKPKYRGLLYAFSESNSQVISNCTTVTGEEESYNFREPAFLKNEENGDASSYNTVGITEDSLQQEYNEMIESVSKYGGFYVARYEGSENNGKIESKANGTTLCTKAMSTWYWLYEICKTYDASSVKSTMIWGSQYDAMMNWLQRNNINVASSTVPNGGSKNTDYSITGQDGSTDVVHNVYDLYGGKFEWTLESVNRISRSKRAGNCQKNYNLSHRTSFYVANLTNSGTRPTLYIR